MYISIHHSLRFKSFVIFIKHPVCPMHWFLLLLMNWVAGVLFLAVLFRIFLSLHPGLFLGWPCSLFMMYHRNISCDSKGAFLFSFTLHKHC